MSEHFYVLTMKHNGKRRLIAGINEVGETIDLTGRKVIQRCNKVPPHWQSRRTAQSTRNKILSWRGFGRFRDSLAIRKIKAI